MISCYSIYTGISWTGGALDFLTSREAIAITLFMMAVSYLSGSKFIENAQFYLPILALIIVLVLIHGLIDHMHARRLLHGYKLCFGDVVRPGDVPPPINPNWMPEVIKVSLFGIASVLIPFAIGRRFRKPSMESAR